MSANIVLSDLPSVGTINPLNDLVLIRKGIQDFKATVAQISNVVFSSYTISNTPLLATDVLLLGKNNGDGTYSNYAINPQQLGFLAGTRMWFYQSIAPLGWTVVAGTGDRILGTYLSSGGSETYNAYGLQGTWQQRDVSGVTGNGLTVKQMPNHQHFGHFGKTQSNSLARLIYGASEDQSGGDPVYGTECILGVVGGAGDVPSHDAFGGCDPHNHGSNWRPSACIGEIYEKQS